MFLAVVVSQSVVEDLLKTQTKNSVNRLSKISTAVEVLRYILNRRSLFAVYSQVDQSVPETAGSSLFPRKHGSSFRTGLIDLGENQRLANIMKNSFFSFLITL
jgi:hypothetical protein